MALTAADLKAYCHAEHETDATITMFKDYAVAVLVGAGVRSANVHSDLMNLYELAVKALCLHYYDNRDLALPASSGATQIPAPLGLDSIIQQLKYGPAPTPPPTPTDGETDQTDGDAEEPAADGEAAP